MSWPLSNGRQDYPFEKEYYSVKEISDYLRMHVLTVYRMVNRGEIKAAKIGSRWVIKKEWLGI